MNADNDAPNAPGLPENAYRPLAPGERYEPLVPAARALAEISSRSIVLGLAMTALFSAAAAFIALKLGQGIETAIPIAILAIGFSAVARRPSTILESLQVVALGATAGIIVGGSVFVMPAIYVLGLDSRSGFLQIFLMPLLGAVLGACFLIPFRRYFVADMHGKLPFPEATATTEILVTGEKGGRAAAVLLVALGIGLVLDYLALALRAWRDVFTTALVPSLSYVTEKVKAVFTLSTSAAVMGLGYIIGVEYAAIICAGSFLSYFVLVPLVARLGSGIDVGLFPGLPPVSTLGAEDIFAKYVRLIGIGGIFAAGVISILKMSPVIVQAIGQVGRELGRLRSGAGHLPTAPRTEHDVPMTTVAAILGLTTLAIGAYFRFVVLAGHPGAGVKTLVALALTLVVSALFAAVSAWAVAMISITPVSGMTLTTLILASVVLGHTLGLAGPDGMLATLLIGGVVCTALSMSGSLATLFKVGYWVGGTPRRIEWAVIGGSALASISATAVIMLFARTQGYVASPEHPHPMAAPQANAMAAVVQSMMGSSEAPWFLYGVGAVIAVIVEMTGVSALAFALGMYLPLELNTPILAGALVAWLVRATARGDAALAKARNDRGTLVASGLIAGGALAGVLQGLTDLAAEWGWFTVPTFDADGALGNWIGLAVFLALGAGIWLDARRTRVEP